MTKQNQPSEYTKLSLAFFTKNNQLNWENNNRFKKKKLVTALPLLFALSHKHDWSCSKVPRWVKPLEHHGITVFGDTKQIKMSNHRNRLCQQNPAWVSVCRSGLLNSGLLRPSSWKGFFHCKFKHHVLCYCGRRKPCWTHSCSKKKCVRFWVNLHLPLQLKSRVLPDLTTG